MGKVLMDRRWMYEANRVSLEYISGVNEFLRAAEDHMSSRGSDHMCCPCYDCKNEKMFKNTTQLQDHLIRRGFVAGYTNWIHHGEHMEGSDEGMSGEEENTEGDADSESDEEDVDMPSNDNDLEQMLRDAEGEDLGGRQYDKFLGLMEDSERQLYRGCKAKYTWLSSVLELFKLKATGGWSDKSFTALLQLLADMLPEGNELPKSTYRAKKVLCPLGMDVQRIHACKNDCILFRKEYENLHVCPVCKTSRYKKCKNGKDDDIDGNEEMNRMPAKVVWYLPIIPCLKRMFANPEHEKKIRWHAEGRKVDDLIRHPADSIQWRNIDRKLPEFGTDSRNGRFGMSTDGMNPFGNMSSRHSTWPVALCMYNLPPWLCMKRKYIMLTMLIEGPKQPGNDIDTYLSLMKEDLETLWHEGVETWDADKRENFTLRGLLFCTINDYPAYGNLSGQSTKGATACGQCMEDTASLYLDKSRKTVFMRHRRFLRRNHPYRNLAAEFDGTIEEGSAPPHLSGRQVHDMVKDVDVTLGKGRKLRKGMWKKKSIFWGLPYWKEQDVGHYIDVMHVEKNVFESLIGLLLNIPDKTKDGVKARQDYVKLGIRPELAPVETDKGRTFLPPACYTLSKAEKTELCQCLHNVKVPSGYCANIRKLVSMHDLKLIGMKSHDCHVLMTQILPIAIRGILPGDVRDTIIMLCHFFDRISQKAISIAELDALEARLVVVLCHLEMYFPPSFFDIMPHLMTHLVREIKMCGPVFLRSMYPFERYMGILKGYVRNRSRPEGSIVEGYATEEVVEFCLDYMPHVNPIGLPKSRHAGRLHGVGVLGAKSITAGRDDHARAHFLVLQHMSVVSPYIDEHLVMLRQQNPRKSEAWIKKQHMSLFNQWLQDRVTTTSPSDAMLIWLAKKPYFTVRTYQGYDINGYTFYTKAQDAKSTYQNSGVRVDAFDSAGDKHSYYGFIEEIWELDYVKFKIPIFRCCWAHLTHVKVDEYDVTTVDLSRVGYGTEPFVLAKHVHQVFYMIDPSSKRRHVVRNGKRSIIGVDNVVDEDDYNQFTETGSGDFSFEAETRERGGSYFRNDHREGLTFKGKKQVL